MTTSDETTGLAVRGDVVSLTVEEHEAAIAARDHVISTNDIGKLAPRQRVGLVLAICESLGLNPLSRPFEFLTLDGKVVLYPTKSCTEQLGRLHQISIKKTRQGNVGDLHVVEVEGRMPNGATNFATKYVSLRDARSGAPLAGSKLADAFAKCETGAKRRLVLSMVGLAGLPDEEQGDRARRVWLDAEGNILEHPTDEQRYLIEHPSAARASGHPTYADTATAADSPVPGTSQRPTADELRRPSPTGERATLRPSAEDVRRWLGAWFATVDGTSLDDDERRHRFVEQWCAQYPEGIRTRSLRQFFEHATERQAADLLAHVRAISDDERQRMREDEAAPAADDAETWPSGDDEERPF